MDPATAFALFGAPAISLAVGYKFGWRRGSRIGYAKGFTDGMSPLRRTPGGYVPPSPNISGGQKKTK